MQKEIRVACDDGTKEDSKTAFETCMADQCGRMIEDTVKLQDRVTEHWRPVIQGLRETFSRPTKKFTSVCSWSR